MGVNQNILIIENQYQQYNKLVDKLKEYNVLPLAGDYSLFTDCVRICLNERYTSEYQKTAFDKLEEIIKCYIRIDLLIIDYKLSGSHDGGDGIDMAKQLRKLELLKSVPILFLSRTPQNEQEVMEHRGQIDNSEWLSKSYSGALNLDKVYFDKQIRPRIAEMIIPMKTHWFPAVFKLLRENDLYDGIWEKLDAIHEAFQASGSVPDGLESLLTTLTAKGDGVTRGDVTQTLIAIEKL